jgi:hypothetical protein
MFNIRNNDVFAIRFFFKSHSFNDPVVAFGSSRRKENLIG